MQVKKKPTPPRENEANKRLRRLKELRKMMINHDTLFPKVRFNIDSWINKKPDGPKVQKWFDTKEEAFQRKNIVQCTSAACVLGSAAIHEPFMKEGLTLESQKSDAFDDAPREGMFAIGNDVEFEGDTGFDAGAEFFGISRAESTWLFDPRAYQRATIGSRANVKSDMVIKRLTMLIKHYALNPKVHLIYGDEDFDPNTLPFEYRVAA